jgi:hypothetical protein
MDGQPGPEDAEGAGPDRDLALPPPSAGEGAGGQAPNADPAPNASGGPSPNADPSPPGSGGPSPSPATPGRDPRLAAFAYDESRPGPAPSGALALLIDQLTGPERRCPGADDDQVVGLLRGCAAVESWVASTKLGVVRELMRREAPPSPGGHGDLPETWSPSLRLELAGALACSTQSADGTASLAWELGARLGGIAAKLADGTLTQAKAKAVAETFGQLGDADAAAAEAMIVEELAGKTFPQVLRLAEQAALTVDPELAERRRQQAQRKDARVSFFREQAGTAAISGRDLPPDEALAAMAAVNARAEDYKESGAFGDTPMDVLRAYGYLDLINGRPAADRIAVAEPQDDAADAAESYARAKARAAKTAAQAKAAAQARAEAQARTGNGNGTRPGPDNGGDGGDADGNGGQARANPHPGGPGAGGSGAVPPDPRESRDDDIPGDPDDCSCTDCDGSCLAGDYDLGLDDDEPDNDDDGPRDHDPGDGGHPGDSGDGGDGGDGGGPGSGEPDGGGDPDDDGGPGGPGSGGPGSGGPGSGGPGPRPGAPPKGQARERRPADLVVPLATLLGLARRPGEIHGFGLLDPALARDLAAAAAASPRTEICVTVTSAEGYAIGHGCARPATRSKTPPAGPAPAPVALPARLNLTIPATALPALPGPPSHSTPASRAGPGGHPGPPHHAGQGGHPGPWAFTPSRKRAGTPGGFGTWTLTLPGGRQLAVRLDQVPTLSCDHRYESGGYQPSGRLRHLVQIRDGTCTFPPCNRHARESDFEHALPYDQGGKTCACNAGARSRACHRVKQSRGWEVTQPRPGWHRWKTPAGRVYLQEPKRYTA